jgi:hypothetical protein
MIQHELCKNKTELDEGVLSVFLRVPMLFFHIIVYYPGSLSCPWSGTNSKTEWTLFHGDGGQHSPKATSIPMCSTLSRGRVRGGIIGSWGKHRAEEWSVDGERSQEQLWTHLRNLTQAQGSSHGMAPRVKVLSFGGQQPCYTGLRLLGTWKKCKENNGKDEGLGIRMDYPRGRLICRYLENKKTTIF